MMDTKNVLFQWFTIVLIKSLLLIQEQELILIYQQLTEELQKSILSLRITFGVLVQHKQLTSKSNKGI